MLSPEGVSDSHRVMWHSDHQSWDVHVWLCQSERPCQESRPGEQKEGKKKRKRPWWAELSSGRSCWHSKRIWAPCCLQGFPSKSGSVESVRSWPTEILKTWQLALARASYTLSFSSVQRSNAWLLRNSEHFLWEHIPWLCHILFFTALMPACTKWEQGCLVHA